MVSISLVIFIYLPTKKSYNVCPYNTTMQAKLPDINSAIVRHRTGALSALSQLNYALAATEIGAINSLLPDDYKVKEDTEEYESIIKSQDVLICNNCKKETNYDEISFYERVIEVSLQLLYGVERVLTWDCPFCNENNPKDGTDRLIREKQNPFYTGCMPLPPKKSLFGETLHYRYQFEKWFDVALKEIEHKIGLYRTDYAAQEAGEAIAFEDEDDNGNS